MYFRKNTSKSFEDYFKWKKLPFSVVTITWLIHFGLSGKPWTYTKKQQFPTIFGCFFIFYIVVVFVTPMHFLWFHRCQRHRSRHPHHVMSGGLKSNQNDELQQIPLQISKLSMSVCLTACPSFPSLSANTLTKNKYHNLKIVR